MYQENIQVLHYFETLKLGYLIYSRKNANLFYNQLPILLLNHKRVVIITIIKVVFFSYFLRGHVSQKRMEKTVTWKENVWSYHIPHQHWNKKKSIKLHLKNIPTMFCALLNVRVQQHVWADIRRLRNDILCLMKGLSQ